MGSEMGSNRLPDPLQRREILYGKDTPSETLIECGRLYLEEGRWNDAVEFFGRAHYKEGLFELKELALREGDYFLMSQVSEFLGEELEAEEWKRLGQRALERGKFHFAQKAFGRAGDAEGLKLAQEKIQEMEGKR
ncbi:MAG TPA: hypothetical protein EYP10_11680 [Armatimonadetes bacterium]|nr:hypothetical protein [Armatimonadota bacterium]